MDVGDAGSQLLCKRFLELTGLDLDGVIVFRVQVNTPYLASSRCGRIDEDAELIVVAVIPLKAKPAAAHGKSIRRSAVARIRAVIGLHVSVGLNLKLPIGGLDEEVLPVP